MIDNNGDPMTQLPFLSISDLAQKFNTTVADLTDDDYSAEAAAAFGCSPGDLLYSDGEVTDYDAHEALVSSITPPPGAKAGRLWLGQTADGLTVASVNDCGLQKVWAVG